MTRKYYVNENVLLVNAINSIHKLMSIQQLK